MCPFKPSKDYRFTDCNHRQQSWITQPQLIGQPCPIANQLRRLCDWQIAYEPGKCDDCRREAQLEEESRRKEEYRIRLEELMCSQEQSRLRLENLRVAQMMVAEAAQRERQPREVRPALVRRTRSYEDVERYSEEEIAAGLRGL